MTTSHPLAPVLLTVAYPSSGPHAGYAVLHARGCRHTLRAGDTPRDLPAGWAPLADDWFEVAPCARARR